MIQYDLGLFFFFFLVMCSEVFLVSNIQNAGPSRSGDCVQYFPGIFKWYTQWIILLHMIFSEQIVSCFYRIFSFVCSLTRVGLASILFGSVHSRCVSPTCFVLACCHSRCLERSNAHVEQSWTCISFWFNMYNLTNVTFSLSIYQFPFMQIDYFDAGERTRKEREIIKCVKI